MSEKKPQKEPCGCTESVTTGNGGATIPSEFPPSNVGNAASIAVSVPMIAGMNDAAPSLPITEGLVSGIATWQNNKQITALWSINQNRNSYVSISGIGWKKLANNSDSVIVALTMLSAHAREKGVNVNYREENDGMIHEMYAW